MTKEQKEIYRRGFISCMRDFSCYIEDDVLVHLAQAKAYSSEVYATGYQDGLHNWRGDVGYFACEDMAYELRAEYEGYWGQSDFEHPEA